MTLGRVCAALACVIAAILSYAYLESRGQDFRVIACWGAFGLPALAIGILLRHPIAGALVGLLAGFIGFSVYFGIET